MKILLIGTAESVREIQNMVADFPVEISCCYAEDTSEIKNQLAALPTNIDGIFASGKAVYYEIINNYQPTVPIYYAKRLVLGFSKSIVSYLHSGQKYKKPLFDIIDRKLVEYLISQYELPFEHTTIIEYDQRVSESHYLLSYIKLFKQGDVDVIFTAFGYTYDMLKELNIPCFRIPVTKYDLLADFQNLMREIELQHNKHKAITVHNLELKANPSEQIRFYKDYADLVQGLYMQENQQNLVITNNYASIEQLRSYVVNSLGYENCQKLCISIAGGNNVQNCINNSIYARNFIDEHYPLVVYTDHQVQRYSLTADEQALAVDLVSEISSKTGLLRKHLYKITAYLQNSENNTLTTSELANLLNLTKRSASRIMNALVDSQYAQEIPAYTDTIGRREKCIEILF